MRVTRGASYLESSSPDLALVSGLLRTLRTEIGGPLVHLNLEPGTDMLAREQLSRTLTCVYRHALDTYEQHTSPQRRLWRRPGARVH